MNGLVLAVAGVFVLAGLVLIVLSFLVGRTRSVPAVADTAPATDVDEAKTAFIDEPLATDITDQLEDRRKLEPAAEVTAESAGEPVEPEPAVMAEAEPPAADEAVAAPVAPAANQVGFNFRVQLGFKFLQNGLYQDAVGEFQKALALTDDQESKLKLFVEIGNAFRRQGMTTQAGAAYMQASAYTENQMLLEHLERTISEMMESGSATQGASASEKEE